jgi:hypothetical protein
MRAALIASLVVLCAMLAGIGIRGALADSGPPHYDTTAYCEDFWKGEKGDVNLCVEGEQAAYNNLKGGVGGNSRPDEDVLRRGREVVAWQRELCGFV